MTQRNYKISFCLICLNNLSWLKETILQNIRDAESYGEFELILLDYNSKDGTDYWVKENLGEYIENGKVGYYKTFEPVAPDDNHAKNMAGRLSNGDILCFISAKTFIGPRFANYINQTFNNSPDSVLTTVSGPEDARNININITDRLCIRRTDFLKIHGFNEQITDNNFQYADLLNRLSLINIKQVTIERPLIVNVIYEESNELLKFADVFKLFINYCSPSVSDIIILYKDERYKYGQLIGNLFENASRYTSSYTKKEILFEYAINSSGWEAGKWKAKNEMIHFLSRNGNEYTFIKSNNQYVFLKDMDNNHIFHAIHDYELIENIVKFHQLFYDPTVMGRNRENKTAVINDEGFGRSIVFKNFQWNASIII